MVGTYPGRLRYNIVRSRTPSRDPLPVQHLRRSKGEGENCISCTCGLLTGDMMGHGNTGQQHKLSCEVLKGKYDDDYNILTMIMGKTFSTIVRLPSDSERTVRIGRKYFCSGLDLSKRFSDFFEISKRNILVSGSIASMADFLNNI